MKFIGLVEVGYARLDRLSAKAANLAKTSPKAGKIAGLSVVVLRTCTLVPLYFAQLIVTVGSALANAVGSLRSKSCRNDLKEAKKYLSMDFHGLMMSPIYTARQLVHGVRGVLASPTKPSALYQDSLSKNNPIFRANDHAALFDAS